ncbi:hypothetical protein K501DRAFT_334496 [Backusella circina FSU 941]|nr:hypothetical protein K501DRAFT_334496 [Backusella circina FSU 941]
MLACAQELFFSNEADNFQQKDRRKMKESGKDKEEQVWPSDVEAAFIEGRNELISDFIFRKTSKIRTRKQVSSHIQVLKNTRKNDPHFIRLLTDSVDDLCLPKKPKAPYMQRQNSMNQKINRIRSSESSDESSITSSSSSPCAFNLAYKESQSLLSMFDIKSPSFYEPLFGLDLGSSYFPPSAMTPSSIPPSEGTPTDMSSCAFSYQSLASSSSVDALNQLFVQEGTPVQMPMEDNEVIKPLKKACQRSGSKKSYNKRKASALKSSTATAPQLFPLSASSPSSLIYPNTFPLWPNFLCLYLEYSLTCDPSMSIPHTLSQLADCVPESIPRMDPDLIAKDKCASIIDIIKQYNTPAILSAKVKLNLNLSLDNFIFNNTSFFETKNAQTIECTTTIYSFGNVVLEAKEAQQAVWLNDGKYICSFAYANQFFDAFIKGIRQLQSWEEVDSAVNNLCIVQTFEDVESKTPLLTVIYDFERGQGVIDLSIVTKEFNFF